MKNEYDDMMDDNYREKIEKLSKENKTSSTYLLTKCQTQLNLLRKLLFKYLLPKSIARSSLILGKES